MKISPRHKLIAAAALLLVALPIAAVSQGLSMATLARLALGLAAIGGLAWWLLLARARGAGFSLPPRLVVISRAGLSPRAGLALVEVDGESFLVVHGEGFARLRKTARPKARPRLVTDEVAAARRSALRISRRSTDGGGS